MAKLIDVQVSVNFRNLTNYTRLQQQALARLPEDFVKEVRANTPIDTGNARRNTNLLKTLNDITVKSDYPYARRLDEGWSRQAPDGFVKPSIEWLRNRLRRIFEPRR